MTSLNRTLAWLGVTIALSACGKQEPVRTTAKNCAPQDLGINSTRPDGVTRAFFPDPVAASGVSTLLPASTKLDQYATPVKLQRLGGRGVLEGQYVEVRDNLNCDGWFGAYEPKNQFLYPYGDTRFQEGMTYFVADGYRAKLDAVGYLSPSDPVRMIVHCAKEDNASFYFDLNSVNAYVPTVCLGDSVSQPGSSYADDGVVAVHELQHATTADLYTGGKREEQLNQFFYDEAGALNEAVSDFMALIHAAPSVPSLFDPQQFSRWALSKFYPSFRGTRGAHRCPEYDSAFKAGCTGFPGFSADANTVSYVYPDGMGWPYANNYPGAAPVRSAFEIYSGREEIHTTGILVTGALWDLYDAMKANHNGDAQVVETLAMKAVLEAIRHLPRPTLSNRSPVSFRAFAATLLAMAPEVGMNEADIQAATRVFTERGLVGGPSVEAGWAQRGDGSLESPGVRVEDEPLKLKEWLLGLGGETRDVTQSVSTGLNHKLDPGELVALWFDLKNTSTITAGGVLLKVTSLDPDAVTFVNNRINRGFISPRETQIEYFKINGTGIVSALGGTKNPISTQNTYFGTNPSFNTLRTPRTAVWVKVNPNAARGRTVTFRVEATPSNGFASTVDFPVTIR